jgi:MbtH protein
MSDHTELFTVVVNEEKQFALLREAAPMPSGWGEAGFSGNQEDCMSWVDRRWVDQRPARLRG